MSKKAGTLFSKSLFGYNKRDVNEYIRLADESSAAKNVEYEERIENLQKALEEEKSSSVSEIKGLLEKIETQSKEFELKREELEEKISECEARCATYLKLADAAAFRADNAEKQTEELCALLEARKEEIEKLKSKLDLAEEQSVKLNAEIARMSKGEEKADKAKGVSLRRPAFFKFIKR